MNQETNDEQQNQEATTTNACPPLECRIVPSKFDPASRRREEAYNLRVRRANVIVRQQPLAEDETEPPGSPLCNGDEKRWQENLPAQFAHLKDKYIASYSKGLRHDANFGEVDGNSYCAYLSALKNGSFRYPIAVSHRPSDGHCLGSA